MYSKITNPKTGRKVSVKSRLGKMILKNYLLVLKGGADPAASTAAASGDEKCTVCGHDSHSETVCEVCGHKSNIDKDAELTEDWKKGKGPSTDVNLLSNLSSMDYTLKRIGTFLDNPGWNESDLPVHGSEPLGHWNNPRTLVSMDKYNLEVASGTLGLGHKVSTKVSINLNCDNAEWALFKKRMGNTSSVTVIFIWELLIADAVSTSASGPEFVLPANIKRLKEVKGTCELHINIDDFSKKRPHVRGVPPTNLPKFIRLDKIGTGTKLIKIVSLNHPHYLMPTLIFDDSILDKISSDRDRLKLSGINTRQEYGAVFGGPGYYKLRSEDHFKMDLEMLHENSPEIVSWIIEQLGGTLKIGHLQRSMFQVLDKIVPDTRTNPIFDMDLTKILRLLKAVLKSHTVCKFIIEETKLGFSTWIPRLRATNEPNPSPGWYTHDRLFDGKYSQETGEVEEVEDSLWQTSHITSKPNPDREAGGRGSIAEAFNILNDFNFEYTAAETEDRYAAVPLLPTWTLNTDTIDDPEKDAMVDRIDAILGTEEGVDAVGAAGAAASK